VGPHWTEALDPATGSVFWRLRHGEGYSIGSAPVAGDGLVFFSTGCQRAELVAVRADGAGDVTGTHEAWRARKGVPVMSSPLLTGEGIYWVSDDGVVTAADPRTGEVRWQERLGEAHVASPLAAAGRLYFFGREGKGTVLQAGPRAERLAENRLDGAITASPAAVGKALFVRTDTHLYRLEAR
jgi:outer membrane protein assembly factor BamB